MSVNLYAILFWGIAFEKYNHVPWQTAPDYQADEQWEDRLNRRITDTSYQKSDVDSVYVDIHVGHDSPMYYVAIHESYQSGSHLAADSVDNLTPDPRWCQQIEAFCQIMDIPYQEPGWHLATYLTQ